MPTYFIDDAGDNSDGSTWAKAYSSMYAMLNHGTAPHGTAGAPLASGDLVYIGNDTVDAASYTANTTIVGPTDSPPAILISSTVGSGTSVSYSKSSTRQIDTSNNNANTYSLTLDGAFACYGVYMQSGAGLYISCDTTESGLVSECTFLPGPNGQVSLGSSYTHFVSDNCGIDCTLDGTTGRSNGIVLLQGHAWVRNLVLSNCAYRTGSIVQVDRLAYSEVSGGDFTAATNSSCEIATGHGASYFTNILTPATRTLFVLPASPAVDCAVMFTNVGSADDPAGLAYYNYDMTVLSSTAIYRTGGAQVEGVACSWLVTTSSLSPYRVCEGSPRFTPWIYGTVTETGSRTFTVYITNDTADFDNSQVWLEVEYLSTSDEATWLLESDQRDNNTGAFISILEATDTQTDDTSSTWNGTGPSFTYKQSLAVTATVNETGQFRAHVAIGLSSIASSRYFYVDPQVTVS